MRKLAELFGLSFNYCFYTNAEMYFLKIHVLYSAFVRKRQIIKMKDLELLVTNFAHFGLHFSVVLC